MLLHPIPLALSTVTCNLEHLAVFAARRLTAALGLSLPTWFASMSGSETPAWLSATLSSIEGYLQSGNGHLSRVRRGVIIWHGLGPWEH